MKAALPITVALVLIVVPEATAKEHSRFVTAEMRANALANAQEHPWVQDQQRKAIQQAKGYVNRSDDELWARVPSQEVPRTVYTNKGVIYEGQKPFCPGCGEAAPAKYGRSWWAMTRSRPWTVQCKLCKEIYPKNDFEAYYKSALDENGCFRRGRGDKSLLFNKEHPDPNDPLHKLYVDDGYGMFDEQGKRHDMVAFYCQNMVWVWIKGGVRALAHAYTLTCDPRYAHKAAVLLDRIADVYPEMDWGPLDKLGFQHSQGGWRIGRIQGCLWENDTVWDLSRGYDRIFDGIQDDAALVEFCSKQAKRYKLPDKSSIAAISLHIEENLLLEMLRSYKDRRIDGNKARIRNPAAAAIALDRGEVTRQWLDYLFDPGFPHEKYQNPVPVLAVDQLDRDGMGSMCGGYGTMQKNSLIDLADVLAAYPPYTTHNLVADYPKLKQAYLIESRLNVLDAMMPCTGDSGAAGSWGRVGAISTLLRGYKLYRDPRMARLAWRDAGGDSLKLRLATDVFERDPDTLAKAIAKVAGDQPTTLKCEHLGRYGQAYLQTEHKDNGRAVFVHHAEAKSHSHHDNLNLGILAKNVSMIPDLGYPEYTGSWPKRGAWTANTISHNTLQIGDTRAAYSPGGKLEMFIDAKPLRVMQVNSPHNYPGVDVYRRTVALIDISEDDSYVFDVFRAEGGTNHRLSWHGHGSAATTTGLALVRQEQGTYAGEDIPFAKLDGPRASFLQSSGFSYLYDVQRSDGAVDKPYTIDWKMENARGLAARIAEGQEPHLRLHAMTPCDEIALAMGDSPRKFLVMPYVIQSRLGENMQSQFINVLEPYEKTPFIKQVHKLKDEPGVAAVAVELTDGRTDIVISCDKPRKVSFNNVVFNGMFAFIRLKHGKVTHLRMAGGKKLTCGNATLIADTDAYRGTVTQIDVSDSEDNRVYLDPPLPASAVGLTVHFINDDPRDTSYEVNRVIASGISTGDITIVRGFKDTKDFDAGLVYLVNPGDEYILPIPSSKDF